MKTEEGLQAYTKMKAIQPIIEGLLLNANSESEHFKSFRDVKFFFETLESEIKQIETLIVNLDSRFINLDSRFINLDSNK